MKRHCWVYIEIPDEFCRTGGFDYDESHSICEYETEVCKHCGLLRDSPKSYFRKSCGRKQGMRDKWYWDITDVESK